MPLPAPTPAPSAQFASPVSIIGPHYCVPYEVNLAIVRKVLNVTSGNFEVTDVKGTVIFKVNERILSVHGHRVLFDGAGNPIVTIRDKIRSVHGRWRVFRGDSEKESDLLFSVKRTSVIQARTKLNVFLANNIKEDVCDFKVEGKMSESSCDVYAGQSSSTVAKMENKKTVRGALIGKDHFNVTIKPNVDYAFIVALVVIFDELPAQFQFGK